MRLFVALIPPASLLSRLEDVVAPRREAGSGPRWSRADQRHLTLAFLEDCPRGTVDDLRDGLARVAARTRPLDLQVEGAGCFPSVGAARVLYAAVAGDVPALGALAAGVRTACARAGGRVDGAAFRPHVTLGRFPRPVDASRWVRSLSGYAALPWVADHLTLVESHLPGRGHSPRHDVLAEFPLTGIEGGGRS